MTCGDVCEALPQSLFSSYTPHLFKKTSRSIGDCVLLVSLVFEQATADSTLAQLPLLVLATGYPQSAKFTKGVIIPCFYEFGT